MNTSVKILYKFALFAIIAVLIFSAIWFYGFGKSDYLFSEAGILENMQNFAIAVSGLIFLFAFIKNRNKNKDMWITLFFVVLCYAFLCREVDFERLNLPEWSVILFHGKGRNISIEIAFSIIGVFALKDYKNYINKSKELVFSKRGAFLFIAAIALFAGGIFEHALDSEFFEELLELTGYSCLLTASYFTFNRK